MQYLSKAYNFYSGINPATLSGAIDVIVVRHVNDNGEVTLSSSPFHVRFGKLQVLRAGEKRVTLRLPNNLPAPHTAPFSMKVGETGEAFFVLETEEDVPEELLTSPVVMATEPDEFHAAPPSDDHFMPEIQVPGLSSPSHPGNSLTQQPFGGTEKQVHGDHLGDVDFLDLNDTVRDQPPPAGPMTPSAVSPSSILKTASSVLPSFLSSPTSSKSTSPTLESPPGSPSPIYDESVAKDRGHPIVSSTSNSLNPQAAGPGESSELPDRDVKLSHMPHPDQDALPKVTKGQGEGPDVVYGRDVVLDMAGYHASGTASEEHLVREEAGMIKELDGVMSAQMSSLVDTLTQDILSCARASPTPRPGLPPRATDPELASVNDVALNALTLLDEPASPPRRFERGQSEPPQTPERRPPNPLGRPLAPSPKIEPAAFPTAVGMHPSASSVAMDHAWDWSKQPHPDIPARRASEIPPSVEERIQSGSFPPGSVTAASGKLKNVEENPFLFVLEMDDGRTHAFELALCAGVDFAHEGGLSSDEEAVFIKRRISFQRFIEDPQVVDDPRLVIRYSLLCLTWTTAYPLLFALSMYRKTLAPPNLATVPSDAGVDIPPRPSSGYGWTKWWRRSQAPTPSQPPQRRSSVEDIAQLDVKPSEKPAVSTGAKHYAKTLRLSSDQLEQLNLKPGPNTVQFSVTSSYSGLATCTSRIFLWEETDQIVISDIDGTITKSDALGHVFAAIGRDWTHPGIAKLYTDIGNNGYKMLYLTSRAIGQADSTREYLRTINQGDYRMPEGPVVMSPDRLMASLHREVIMRKPELFKMACLRDIQRLFGDHAKEAFYAGFGNRITDAMSYRSVGIEASKIYTIDSTGVVKTELLQAAGHKGSYVLLNDLVNEVFPPVSTKFKPEYTDFNFWRVSIPEIALPDLAPPSPALSARSDSSRYSVLGKIATLGRRSSKQPILPTHEPSSRPSSPLMGPAMTPDDLSEVDDDDVGRRSRQSSMPGSFEDRSNHFPDSFIGRSGDVEAQDDVPVEEDSFDDGAIFDDDLLATGEMQHVPF